MSHLMYRNSSLAYGIVPGSRHGTDMYQDRIIYPRRPVFLIDIVWERCNPKIVFYMGKEIDVQGAVRAAAETETHLELVLDFGPRFVDGPGCFQQKYFDAVGHKSFT